MNIEEVCRGFRAWLRKRPGVSHTEPEWAMLADAFEECGRENVARYLRERLSGMRLSEYPGLQDVLSVSVRYSAPREETYRDPTSGRMAISFLAELLERNYEK